jgi:site-specific DNA-methyltransferase (adenine-specific)
MKRLDLAGELRERILPLCRLQRGEIWEDPRRGHRVGVLDAAAYEDVRKLMESSRTGLLINDPPYNLSGMGRRKGTASHETLAQYMAFSRRWVQNAVAFMKEQAHLYIWMGTDVRKGFQPLPDFMLMMRDFGSLRPRSLITMRNQRGYGTQKNWMWIRQELLYYVRGDPPFHPVYTDIHKTLRGYYKKIGGRNTENWERGRGETLRPGNVWFDVQQVFYRREENVPGCYAQKPLKAIERIIRASADGKAPIVDLFSHSGTTLVVGEILGRRVYTMDIDPVFVELTIRRLERLREASKTGWQWQNPFPELVEEPGTRWS